MSKLKLNPFACPVCDDGTTVEIEISEESLNEAKRFPMMVTTRCSKNHDLIAFVDREKNVRDVESAITAKKELNDAIEKSKEYFESF